MLKKGGVIRPAAQITNGDVRLHLRRRQAVVFSNRFCQASYTVPPLGLGTTLVTSRRNCLRLGTAEPPNFAPETATSILKYAGEFRSSTSCCSTHSVEPIKPSSSPSQLANTMVRFGFQPARSNSPTPCT